MLLGERFWNEREEQRIRRDLRERYPRERELVREHLRDLLVRDEVTRDENLAEASAVRALIAERAIENVLRNEPSINEELTERQSRGGHEKRTLLHWRLKLEVMPRPARAEEWRARRSRRVVGRAFMVGAHA